MIYYFVFDVYTVLWLKTTFSGILGGWMGGWINWKYNQLSLQLVWVGAGTELGNKEDFHL